MSPNSRPLDEVADRLHSLAIHVLRRVRREDEATGLSPSRLSALSVLVFGGPMALGRLAAAEQVTPASMSVTARALEEQGLVRRERDPADARALRLEATAEGRRLLEAGRRRRVEHLSRLLGRLSAEEGEVVAQAIPLLEEMLR